MKKKILGPTIISFISYSGVNLMFIILPILFFTLNVLKEIRFYGIILIFLGFFTFYLRALADAHWVIIDNSGITIITYFFHWTKIEWNKIEKILSSGNLSYGSLGAWRGGFYWSAWTGYKVLYQWDHESRITSSMWSDEVDDQFFWLLSDKSKEFGFQFEKLEYNP